MKYKPKMRVAFYDHRGQSHRAVVIAATREWVRIRLWDGREVLLDDHESVSRLSRLRY